MSLDLHNEIVQKMKSLNEQYNNLVSQLKKMLETMTNNNFSDDPTLKSIYEVVYESRMKMTDFNKKFRELDFELKKNTPESDAERLKFAQFDINANNLLREISIVSNKWELGTSSVVKELHAKVKFVRDETTKDFEKVFTIVEAISDFITTAERKLEDLDTRVGLLENHGLVAQTKMVTMQDIALLRDDLANQFNNIQRNLPSNTLIKYSDN